ncbi:hypothetical protein [Nocardioides lianchengensis]|uniref:Uncharacterized protein n=1 Tax=Nocardioides lianchengensis TaxID=1045774 RepID=A0A1G6Y5V1_9ACTN|nr:hypothetical protein [Nocardioides lianchengensis]NYG13554.1 hypothetical protein [Nocardioides lianchengensis]SDD85363.1 hypothetical protein SAMN05421872_111200 [Nocardioides lianchengensis]
MAQGEGRPVLTGIVALVGVAVVVGLVLGGAALAATQVLGLGEDSATTQTSSAESLYLPTPSKTPDSNDPAITFAPGETSSAPAPTESEEPEDEITLSLGKSEVGPMENIDLTGVYPDGEGAILQVERLAGEEWIEFPVTASVSNETFTTYVQTGQLGKNKFRMKDTDNGLVSNEVTVTVR